VLASSLRTRSSWRRDPAARYPHSWGESSYAPLNRRLALVARASIAATWRHRLQPRKNKMGGVSRLPSLYLAPPIWVSVLTGLTAALGAIGWSASIATPLGVDAANQIWLQIHFPLLLAADAAAVLAGILACVCYHCLGPTEPPQAARGHHHDLTNFAGLCAWVRHAGMAAVTAMRNAQGLAGAASKCNLLRREAH
jgi:hypothetical protein